MGDDQLPQSPRHLDYPMNRLYFDTVKRLYVRLFDYEAVTALAIAVPNVNRGLAEQVKYRVYYADLIGPTWPQERLEDITLGYSLRAKIDHDTLGRELLEDGIRTPILVAENLKLLDGYRRFYAFLALKEQKIPVVYVKSGI
jgi:hypothetical protein